MWVLGINLRILWTVNALNTEPSQQPPSFFLSGSSGDPTQDGTWKTSSLPLIVVVALTLKVNATFSLGLTGSWACIDLSHTLFFVLQQLLLGLLEK